MRIKYISIAVFVSLLLHSSSETKAESTFYLSNTQDFTEIRVSPTNATDRVFRFVKRWIRRHVYDGEITMETNFVEIGMDSLNFIELCIATENRFNVDISRTYFMSSDLIVADFVNGVASCLE